VKGILLVVFLEVMSSQDALAAPLDGTNFHTWKVDIIGLLNCKGLRLFVKKDVKKIIEERKQAQGNGIVLEAEIIRDLQVKDEKALGYILRTCEDTFKDLIANSKSAKSAWKDSESIL
jgi:hypothetical protein